ncbi:hypothetical protein HDU87_004334 [Geranomyces variabilis]|uniref:Uncharacterized protein n=1 Tax=Geranomyces variabilis TaxID=109894 RepID=A0AAD5XQP7_9FUNG|nr:hypothetical protein HDU87_004334 [Geranomyces variabilis]
MAPGDQIAVDASGEFLFAVTWDRYCEYISKLEPLPESVCSDLILIFDRDHLAIETVLSITPFTAQRARKLIELHKLCGTFDKPPFVWTSEQGSNSDAELDDRITVPADREMPLRGP